MPRRRIRSRNDENGGRPAERLHLRTGDGWIRESLRSYVPAVMTPGSMHRRNGTCRAANGSPIVRSAAAMSPPLRSSSSFASRTRPPTEQKTCPPPRGRLEAGLILSPGPAVAATGLNSRLRSRLKEATQETNLAALLPSVPGGAQLANVAEDALPRTALLQYGERLASRTAPLSGVRDSAVALVTDGAWRMRVAAPGRRRTGCGGSVGRTRTSGSRPRRCSAHIVGNRRAW